MEDSKGKGDLPTKGEARLRNVKTDTKKVTVPLAEVKVSSSNENLTASSRA